MEFYSKRVDGEIPTRFNLNWTHKFSIGIRSRRQDVLVNKGEIRVIENRVVGSNVDEQRWKTRRNTHDKRLHL